MSNHNRILFPVDLSKNSLSALDMASELAQQRNSRLCFIYVAQPLLPEEAMYGTNFRNRIIEEDRQEFEELRPSAPNVEFEHVFSQGNPGPIIVNATKSADLCVMSTHGYSGIVRFIMGSVAQYVLRNSACPVILVKGLKQIEPRPSESEEPMQFVTDVMRQVAPIHKFDKMEDVLDQLKKANETAAPVVELENRCAGILTRTDIEKYLNLKARYDAKDNTVIKEMFETDKYGQVRCGNHDFDQVKRHMTEEVISVRNTDTIDKAAEVFEANEKIHHLVVLDEDGHPVGIVNWVDMPASLPQELNASTQKT